MRMAGVGSASVLSFDSPSAKLRLAESSLTGCCWEPVLAIISTPISFGLVGKPYKPKIKVEKTMKLGKVEMHYLEGSSQVLLSGISRTNLEVLRGFQSHIQECSSNHVVLWIGGVS